MKKLFALTMAFMTVLVFTACNKSSAKPTATPAVTAPTQQTTAASPTPAGQVPMFSVVVDGVEDATEFNQGYYMDMNEKTVTLSVQNSAGEKKDYTCRGVYLKDVLSALGAENYKSVNVIAADMEQKFDSKLIQEDTTFFAIEVNGSLEDCPVIIGASKGSKYMVKSVIQLVIEQ